MGNPKAKDAGGKGKGKAKQAGADESASKGKGKSGKGASDGLGTCTYVKGTLSFFYFIFFNPVLHGYKFIVFAINFLRFRGLSGRILFRFSGICCLARHILSEKQGKINEAYKKLQDGWLSNGDKVPPAEFAKVRGLFLHILASSIS